MLKAGMKILFLIVLLFLLAGCAAPYYHVPVSSDGDYYIAERQTSGPYYGSNTVFYGDLGIYPWWMAGYPVELFSYYSPYYYPHYFSVWQPPGFHPFHGFYGRHYAYWCPPYRPRVHREMRAGDKVVSSPVARPPAIVTYPGNAELRRVNDLAAVNSGVRSRGASYKPAASRQTRGMPGSLPVYGRSSPSMTRSPGSGRSSARSTSARGSRAVAGKATAIHKH